jgi:DNA-binding transcriptional regulator YiaG
MLHCSIAVTARVQDAANPRRYCGSMPNIAFVLKSEVTRLARKQVRAEVAGLKKAATTYRSEIASLKRRVESLEKALRKAGSAKDRAGQFESAAGEGPAVRFSAKGFASHRRRLGLSAQDLGVLLNTSGQTIYNWEAGKARPRASHLPAIAALRRLGRREAAAILASL